MLIWLFIFFIVWDFGIFGLILAGIIIVESIISLIFGHYVDKNPKESLKKSAKMHAATNLSMWLFAKTAVLTTIIQIFNQIAWNLFDNSFTTKIHKKIKLSKQDPFVYASTKEMALCFWEVFVFSFYIILALLFREIYVFKFIFIFTIFWIYLAVQYFEE